MYVKYVLPRGVAFGVKEEDYYMVGHFLFGAVGRDCMVVGFTTTYAISAYHH